MEECSRTPMRGNFRPVTGQTLPAAVADHLSEGSFVRNVVVQIPKFGAKPNSNSNPNSNPNPMPIHFGQMTLRTSELLLRPRLCCFHGSGLHGDGVDGDPADFAGFPRGWNKCCGSPTPWMKTGVAALPRRCKGNAEIMTHIL